MAAPIPFVEDRDFVLYVGDVRDVLAGLPEGSVDCCVTSPPYWGLRDYGHTGQIGLEATPDEYVAVMVAVFREVGRVLKPSGTLWLNLGDSYARDPGKGGSGPNGKHDFIPDYGKAREIVKDKRLPRGEGRWGGGNVVAPGLKQKDLCGIPWRVALALQADGWYLRCDIIWHKPNPMPESVTDRPTRAHEYVFLLSKSPRYHYDAEAIQEPARWFGPNGQPKSGPHAGQMKGCAGKGHTPATWEERKAAGAGPGNVGRSVSHELGDGLTRNARSVWAIQTVQYAEAHFATFPIELPLRCIRASCPEGGTVLDPFIGSGTTALAARKLGRKSIGIEINPGYAKLCATRLQQQSLFAESAA